MDRYQGRAVVFTAPRKAEVHEPVSFPEMDEEGVVIRTRYSVISRGTELDLYTGQMHGRGANAQTYPLLPGYMPCGEVIEAGSKVTHLKVGDCAIGSNLFEGFDPRYCVAWGGHCEYTVISRQSHPWHAAGRAVKVAEGVPAHCASLAVLGAVARKGVDRKVRPQAGETVLVVGQGVIGLFAAQLCRLAGARVIVADLEESRLAVARQCGIEETVNAASEPLADAAARLTDGKGPDVAIDVTGEPDVLMQAIALTRVGGRVHGQGMYLQEVSLYLPETLFGRDLTLSATCGEDPSDAAAVMDLMAEGKLVYEPMLSDVMPVAAATEAYERVHDRPDEVLTVALQW
ncbi:MAG: zinc-dependent alcohol dehydrogenase [Planctomycetota bacterium]|jgi:L-iditol 2-dehydrogenase